MANNTIINGWRDQPDGRGTFDILKTCGGTIFLLCWSSVCPNVPSLQGGLWTKFRGKVSLFCLAILGPEFVFTMALGQVCSASRAKDAFRQDGHSGWSLRHCFFINMGGLHVEFRDRKDAGLTSFPVDCEQLRYLVKRGDVSMPDLGTEDIEDRNKADKMARTITIIQTLWFTADLFGRLAQGLHITTMELTTLAFVFMMSCCSICWWYKPMDISRPITIPSNTDLSTILHESNTAQRGFGRTPLSFLNKNEWFMSQFWFYYTQILRDLKLLPDFDSKPLEFDHFTSIDFPDLGRKRNWWYTGWVIPAYCAIFMAVWNSTFPTAIEKELWRLAATISMGYGFLGSFIAFGYHYHVYFRQLYHNVSQYLYHTKEEGSEAPRGTDSEDGGRRYSGTARFLEIISRHIDWMRNLSPDHDPMLAIPVRLWLLVTPMCAAYLISRAYILIEDVIALRSLPTSAFQTVDWGQYSPLF